MTDAQPPPGAPQEPTPPPGPEQPPVSSPPPGYAPPGPPLVQTGVEIKPADERRAALAQQLQQAATRGLRVESQQDYQAVLIEGKPVNHTLHAILTIVTCFLWGVVWAVLAATGGEKRHQLLVDEFGNVHWQNLGKA